MLTRVMTLLNARGFDRDVALALGVAAIIGMLILPMPPWLLDMGLALSITLSVMILMVALFIERPLDLSAFPTILLIATMLRLGLNLASTRLILGHGHEGPHAAGGVIAAFGQFLLGGETLIGLTIFLILILINFVVITKGAGRIAEVAARFSLDAMPGKQMAIDADLNAGLIDEATAKLRRAELEAESGFFGAMDGASKFVKGDAVAGLAITAVNIVVGLIVGVVNHGVDLATAFNSYTVLTVGDGLVSQIPALITSTAAGLLVSKGGMRGRAGAALGEQFGRHPKAFAMAAALLIALALLPGLPLIPFGTLGAGCALLAWRGFKAETQRQVAAEAQRVAAEQAMAPVEEPVAATIAIDPVRVELGFGLLPLVQAKGGEVRLDDQIRALRRQIATDFGFVLPPVRILDNMALPANAYRIYIRESGAGEGEVDVTRLLVINPPEQLNGLAGEPAVEPVFGLPALSIPRALADEAGIRGLTAVDAGTIITTHLTEAIKDNIADLLSYTEVQKLLNETHKASEKLIADVIPAKISVSGLQRVLQNLLAEGVSIRDLPTILEAIAEAVPTLHGLTEITEHARSRLARQITATHATDAALVACTLAPAWEAELIDALHGDGADRQLALAPSRIQALVAALREGYDRFARDGEAPALVVSPILRPYVRSIVERARAHTAVLSQAEVHPRVRLKLVGHIAHGHDAPQLADATAAPRPLAA